jgi:ATP-dependent RNA helicase RhlB
MFDMGFIADLRFILRRLPPFDQRQNLMFSATLNPRVMELAYEFMNAPEKISVSGDRITADAVEQVLYHVSRREKFPLVAGASPPRQHDTHHHFHQHQTGRRAPP